MGRDIFHQPRVLRAPSSLALNPAREGTATASLGSLLLWAASLGSLCQGLTTLIVKSFFLTSTLKYTLFQFKDITPCPTPTCPCQKSLSSFLVGPFRYWNAAWSLLFSGLNNPNSLSLYSQQRCSSPWIIFVASSGPTPRGPGLSCAEGSRAGCRTPGGSYQSGAEWQNPLPCPAGHAAFDAAQDMVGLLGCKHTFVAHVQLFTHQISVLSPHHYSVIT